MGTEFVEYTVCKIGFFSDADGNLLSSYETIYEFSAACSRNDF